MTTGDANELEQLEEPWQKRECRRRQLERRDRGLEYCAHGTPTCDRCFLCEPLKVHLFPPREDRR